MNKSTMPSPEKNRTTEKTIRLIINSREYRSLHKDDRGTLDRLMNRSHYSFQQLKQMCDWALDFRCWEEEALSAMTFVEDQTNQFVFLREKWLALKTRPKDYEGFGGMILQRDLERKTRPQLVDTIKPALALGDCPVASARTRCCQLKTLDVIEGCGFDCSYCSIKTFYEPGKVVFDKDFAKKLSQLELEKDRLYHIGTGQSSDSLLWADRWGALDALIDFAFRHPKVILELKTKAASIQPLLDRELPPNLVCTWSLNTPTLIEKEEHRTASLEQRVTSARTMADRGVLVGFHFHPLVYYHNWVDEYRSVCDYVLERFSHDELMMVSMGTLTFIRPVIKRLRTSLYRSKILQMPLVEAEGKLSYPLDIKEELFSTVYRYFEPWHDKVFFYLCMEDPSLWLPVFGREYKTNDEFERDMLQSYWKKIQQKRGVV